MLEVDTDSKRLEHHHTESDRSGFDPRTYKDVALVKALQVRIQDLASRLGRPVKLMHICGTHEHEMGRYALRELLPDTVRVLAGPGCPVCVCDVEYIDAAIRLALMPNVILCSFGDMMGVPGSIPLTGERRGDVRMSLLDAKLTVPCVVFCKRHSKSVKAGAENRVLKKYFDSYRPKMSPAV